MLLLPACGDDDGGGDERDAAADEPADRKEEADDRSDLGEDVVVEPVRLGSLDAVIPRPSSVTPAGDQFPLTEATAIVVDDGADAGKAVDLLRGYLGPVTGLELPLVDDVGDDPGDLPDRAIRFTSEGVDGLGEEGYELRIEPDRVDVVAGGSAGFGWAVQTIRQLLPPEIDGGEALPETFALPTGTIRDVPRLAWRGTMLDVARHFFPPEDVERVVDIAAAYKLNVLHLHLTDDQGWRLAIEKHPELTEVGASTEVGGGPGGFYTQDEYRGIVEYAAERGITIVPEIDMPGHTNAALASIPELNCDGQAPAPYTDTQVGFSSLCVDLELTYEFVEDVVAEVAALTPGPYVHIGGDEADETSPEDYRRFVERAADIVRSHGKTPMGWDELGHVDLGSDAVLQHWRYPEDAVAAAGQGMDVVMSPATNTYLDMKYGDFSPGNTWAGHIDTRTAYEWDPQAVVDGLPDEAVVGLEAPLWTELVTTREEIEQRMLPRLPGYAELGWSAPEGRSWQEYSARLAGQAARWTAAGWSYTEDPAVPW